ncbi:hypothetical protein J2X36_004550 [Methylobacterium sp. BE186]|uniref:DUF6878 family protein n=1 Tax=Methylobacterium sp. BE186 TaxID=2817715 RepID=UPI002866113A|nr:DUF6878 family protein [Methylobacterium sp. BE186]MDR7039772.1 hypothetical protein [Methylobacterium sp. BE186]
MPDTDNDEYAAKRNSIFEELAQHGVERITVVFDGGGDEGQIDSIEAFGADAEPIELDWSSTNDPAVRSMHDVVEEFAYEALDGVPVDWCNDLGGYGEIEIAVPTGSIEVEVTKRFEASETSHWER